LSPDYFLKIFIADGILFETIRNNLTIYPQSPALKLLKQICFSKTRDKPLSACQEYQALKLCKWKVAKLEMMTTGSL
jgi:hypothetical protein